MLKTSAENNCSAKEARVSNNETYRCKTCQERCEPDNPWVHLNPDLDLDHPAKPDLNRPAGPPK